MDLKEENLPANLDVADVGPRGTGEGAEVLSPGGRVELPEDSLPLCRDLRRKCSPAHPAEGQQSVSHPSETAARFFSVAARSHRLLFCFCAAGK